MLYLAMLHGHRGKTAWIRLWSSIAGATSRMHLLQLPAEILSRILHEAFKDQTVVLCERETGVVVQPRFLPPLLISQKINRLARAVPIRLLHITPGAAPTPDVVRVLGSIRSPARTVHWVLQRPDCMNAMQHWMTDYEWPGQLEMLKVSSHHAHCRRDALDEMIKGTKNTFPSCQVQVNGQRP